MNHYISLKILFPFLLLLFIADVHASWDNGGRPDYYPDDKRIFQDMDYMDHKKLCTLLASTPDNEAVFESEKLFFLDKYGFIYADAYQRRGFNMDCKQHDFPENYGIMEPMEYVSIGDLIFSPVGDSRLRKFVKHTGVKLDRNQYIAINRGGEVYAGPAWQVAKVLNEKFGEDYATLVRIYNSDKYSQGEYIECDTLKKRGQIHACIFPN